MKKGIIVFLQLSFVLQQVIGCSYPKFTKLYRDEIFLIDSFPNKLSIYWMPNQGFAFIDSTGKYKDGDIGTVEQRILFKRKFSIGQ